MGFELNNQQLYAGLEMEKWWTKCMKQVFEISGPAGSGKTTIVSYLIDTLGLKHEEVLFMAYVGKATMALARKGNFAKTIHSSIYDVVYVPKIDEYGNIVMKNNRVVTVMAFQLKKYLPKSIKLIVIDEGSMLNEKIAKDVLSFGLPVIVLGDLNQLKPIFGNPYFLQNPDVILTEIMRQKANDPIIYLSQRALKGEDIFTGKYGERCYAIYKDQVTDDMFTKPDVVICGKNKTRDEINNYVRKSILKIDSQLPRIGEKVICRQNNWEKSIDNNIFLINGLVGYVENVYMESYNKKSICIDFRPEFLDDKVFKKIAIDYKYLFSSFEEKENKRCYYEKFEFANAITCHLAQGSQYPNVLVFNEGFGSRDDRRRWLYTAITRAASGLILAV